MASIALPCSQRTSPRIAWAEADFGYDLHPLQQLRGFCVTLLILQADSLIEQVFNSGWNALTVEFIYRISIVFDAFEAILDALLLFSISSIAG